MSPELVKTRGRRIAVLLDRLADLVLLLALFLGLYLAVDKTDAGGSATILLVILLLVPALGLKLWARRVMRGRVPPPR